MTGARGYGEVAAYLLELAGPEVYTRNAFRLTGLATNADARAIREQRQRLTTKAATGDEQAAQALAALDDLRDERHRLVHELFVAWHGERHNSCGCPHSVHATHTVAVRAHAQALSEEQSGSTKSAEQHWTEAADAWRKLLRHAAFWDHLRYRIGQLGDRRMNEATVAEIRQVLPTALAEPIVRLALAATSPSRLVNRAAGWNFGTHAADDLFAEAAAPLITGIEEVVRKAGEDIDGNRPSRAATVLLEQAVPKVKQLDALLPHKTHRATAQTRDQVAILLNNAALAIVDKPKPPGVSVRKLFDTALSLVTSPSQRTVIEGNAAAAKQRREIDADLRRFGFTVENDGFAKLADLLTECLTNGRFSEAEDILTVMRRHATDPTEKQQIEALLSQLSVLNLTPQPPFGLLGGLNDETRAAALRLLQEEGMVGRPSYQPYARPAYRRANSPLRRSRRLAGRTLRLSLGIGWIVPIMLGMAFGVGWGVLASVVYLLGVFAIASMVRT